MSWQDELRNGYRTAEELAPILGWTPEETARYAEVIQRYPMLIPPYYLSLVDPKDPEDPIARMCVPSLAELEAGGETDTRRPCSCPRTSAPCTAATASASGWWASPTRS